ncbi:alpha-E domain-containing protein [Phototrophicus methaneseepsis]|uniref:Alpha-E domain-containing protein n=1 Tax=Phototrophicus methaneseepsis TaxID=2710758 RepID=A0A7S8EBZ0_9CHLR|nr:alpha-E domain-containing protein [Phototrophicus methaneseepsis]QPC84141.1 alpha-E domain-containing protein [Phototrophicus methaneseepsis]
MSNQQTMLSRVADSLYWMSRYLERAEHTGRLLDVHLNSTLDAPKKEELARIHRLQQCLSVAPNGIDTTEGLLEHFTFAADDTTTIITNVTLARENARQIREQLSSEMWTQLNTLYLSVLAARSSGLWRSAPHDFYIMVKEGAHLFQGITDATMNHGQGWHFIQIGRYLERALNLLNLLYVHFQDETWLERGDVGTQRYFELVAILKSVTAFEAYCKVYNPNLQSRWIAEFLLFNEAFPRSLRFCVDTIQASLLTLADATQRNRGTRLYRASGRLQSSLSYDEISDITDLRAYISSVKEQLLDIHVMLYGTFVNYPIETAL